MLYEALYGTDIYSSRDETVLYELCMDLGGVEPWKLTLQTEDLFDGGIRERACRTLV